MKPSATVMRDVVLSASSRFYPFVVQLRDQLEADGIKVHTPDMDFVSRPASEISADQKRQLTTAFLSKIENSRAICVVTDASGYVGRSVSLEVGFAYALGRPMYSIAPIEDPAIGALCTALPSAEELVRELKVLRRILKFDRKKAEPASKSSSGRIKSRKAVGWK